MTTHGVMSLQPPPENAYPPRLHTGPTTYRPDSPIDIDDPYAAKPSYLSGYASQASSLPSPNPRDDRGQFFPSSTRTNTMNTMNFGASTSSNPQRGGYSRWAWIFLAVVIVQAAIGLAIEGYVFARFQEDLASWARNQQQSKPYAATLPSYLALFIFGFLYELGLVVDALRLKNTIQIIGLCLYNVGLLIEAAVQFLQLSDVVRALDTRIAPPEGDGPALQSAFSAQVHPYIIAMPAVLGLGSVLMGLSAYYLYKEFAWSVFDRYGPSVGIRNAFRFYEVYLSLLKFDFFFFVAFTVLFLVVVQETGNLEFYLTIAALPITVVIFALALFWVRRESLWGMVTTIFLYLLALAYFFIKLFRMWFGPADRVGDYIPARRSLTTFAVLTICLLIITVAIAITCTRNFNRGLRDRLTRKRSPTGGDAELMTLHHAVPMPERLIID